MVFLLLLFFSSYEFYHKGFDNMPVIHTQQHSILHTRSYLSLGHRRLDDVHGSVIQHNEISFQQVRE